MRTPLTYYGGKQRLAAQIVSYMPSHVARLRKEDGSATSERLEIGAERETLNDLDGQIVRFWRALRGRPDELAASVAATPYSRAEWEICDEPSDDDVEAARRLLVRIGQSWAREGTSWSPPSIVKTNMGRWQPRTWEELPSRLLAAARRLTNVCVEHCDGVDMIARWDTPGAVVYVDPPYFGPGRKAPSHGYLIDADVDLWPRLVDALLLIEKAAVILSGYPNSDTERLGWRSVQLQVPSGAPETLWLSPEVPAPIPDLLEAIA